MRSLGKECARARPRARSGAHADAVGRKRECRLHARRSLAAALQRSCDRQRAAAARRVVLDALALSRADWAATARACIVGRRTCEGGGNRLGADLSALPRWTMAFGRAQLQR